MKLRSISEILHSDLSASGSFCCWWNVSEVVTSVEREHGAAVCGKGLERRSQWKENERVRAGSRLTERMLKVWGQYGRNQWINQEQNTGAVNYDQESVDAIKKYPEMVVVSSVVFELFLILLIFQVKKCSYSWILPVVYSFTSSPGLQTYITLHVLCSFGQTHKCIEVCSCSRLSAA